MKVILGNAHISSSQYRFCKLAAQAVQVLSLRDSLPVAFRLRGGPVSVVRGPTRRL